MYGECDLIFLLVALRFQKPVVEFSLENSKALDTRRRRAEKSQVIFSPTVSSSYITHWYLSTPSEFCYI